jgi:hypothetical protein
MAVTMPREKWTDERLDEDIRELRSEIKGLHSRFDKMNESMNSRFDAMNKSMNLRFDALNRNLIWIGVMVVVALIDVNAS